MLKAATLTALTISSILISTGISDAKRSSNTASMESSNSGVVRSSKTGATARVGVAHAAKFQAYIDDLEAGGASIRFMGGIRRGRCANSSMHPCGRALDICQLSRGRVDSRCHLPGRQAVAAIANRHGLFEGGQWCHSDYGHAQVGVTAEACGNTMSAKRHRKTRIVNDANGNMAVSYRPDITSSH